MYGTEWSEEKIKLRMEENTHKTHEKRMKKGSELFFVRWWK